MMRLDVGQQERRSGAAGSRGNHLHIEAGMGAGRRSALIKGASESDSGWNERAEKSWKAPIGAAGL